MEEINNGLEPEPQPDELKAATPWYEQDISLEEAKSFIRTNMVTAARSFIAVGFYLKCVRDRELFTEDGYESIWDFAKGEYGLSTSSASRYMSMNDRFSVGGNSPIIQEQYREFEKSKLQEMLSLTDEQLEQVTPENSVLELRAMKPPKPVPYVDIPGQLDIEVDFPQFLPDNYSSLTQPPAESPGFMLNINDLISENTVAISQQIEAPAVINHCPDSASAFVIDVGELMGAELGNPVEPVIIDVDMPEAYQLPEFKNATQVKKWLKAYEDWPLWLDISVIGEKYYRIEVDGYYIVNNTVERYNEFAKAIEIDRNDSFWLMPKDYSHFNSTSHYKHIEYMVKWIGERTLQQEGA